MRLLKKTTKKVFFFDYYKLTSKFCQKKTTTKLFIYRLFYRVQKTIKNFFINVRFYVVFVENNLKQNLIAHIYRKQKLLVKKSFK